jgi:hypothetical protein
MSDGSNLDPNSFDVDSWIDGVVRPEVTVPLYPHDAEFAARLKAVTDLIPAAEKTNPEDRGLDDPTPEALRLQVAEITAEREASALRVRVQQRTKLERGETLAEALRAGVQDKETTTAWLLSAACVEPKFTPDQILRLLHRDDSGEQMVLQLIRAVDSLDGGLTPPFSPAPSGDSQE